MRRLIALAFLFFAFCLVTSTALAQTTTVVFDGVLDDLVTPFSGTYTLDNTAVGGPFFPGTFAYAPTFAGQLTIGAVTTNANFSSVVVGNNIPFPIGDIVPAGADSWIAIGWLFHPAVSCPSGFCLCGVGMIDPAGGRLSSTAYSVQTSLAGWPIAELVCFDAFTNLSVLSGEICVLHQGDLTEDDAEDIEDCAEERDDDDDDDDDDVVDVDAGEGGGDTDAGDVDDCPTPTMGTAGTHIVANVSWSATTGVKAGDGQLHVWTRSIMTFDGNNVTALVSPCGSDVPEWDVVKSVDLEGRLEVGQHGRITALRIAEYV